MTTRPTLSIVSASANEKPPGFHPRGHSRKKQEQERS
nr:MAG TPA: hypothetical protein [Caudoviricetes sp.]